MPKPLLQRSVSQTSEEAVNRLSATSSQNQQQNNISKMKLDRLLKKRRSKEYIKALQELDAGGNLKNHDQAKKIIDMIKAELPEVTLDGILLGVVAACYLGRPYEVHSLDLTNQIITHFKAGEILPNGMERARSIAIRGGYACIEVYVDCCRAISEDGSVSVIPL